VRVRRAVRPLLAAATAALAVVALSGATAADAGAYATMTPMVWEAGTENLEIKIEDAACKGYDLSMIDRLQLKDQYSSEAAFYDYEPALVKPRIDIEGLYEGPVQVQSSAVNGIHHIDVYCNETDLKVGAYEVMIVNGKPPKKKPKKCGDGKVLEKGKCVPKGPVKIPNPNPH
jgi:hypothetical protein